MAAYPTLRYGSTGEEVRKLQEALNASGSYGLTLDGIYGEKTKQAVTAYQKANGLGVDGIAGQETLGHLYRPATPEPETPREPTAWEKWVNREPFSYDPEKDSLYQHYKEQYLNLGRLAMEDTVGKAATLTGGYGNSYAQTAGQQSYEAYMQQLAGVIPELYDRAYDRYTAEGEAMYKEAVAYENQRKQAYNDLEALLKNGYSPTDGELTAAGMTRAQANALRKTTGTARSVSTAKATATPSDTETMQYSDVVMDYTTEDVKSLQMVAGLKPTGTWSDAVEKAYLDGYRPGGSRRIDEFMQLLQPEQYHDAVQRSIWGSYRTYVLAMIMGSPHLKTPEKDYLIQQYGFTQADRNLVKNRGLDKKAKKTQ